MILRTTTAAGIFAIAAVLGVAAPAAAQDDFVVPPPQERSTLDSIQFEPVNDEKLGNTSIEGALGPTAAGIVSEGIDPMIEPVFLSDELRRSLDLDEEVLRKQRRQLFSAPGDLSPAPPQVTMPTFENRTYSPSSSTSSTFRE